MISLRHISRLEQVDGDYISAAQEGALSTPANDLIKLMLLLAGVGRKNHLYSG